MKLAPALVTSILFLSSYLNAASIWTPIADKLQQSVTFIEMEFKDAEGVVHGGSCSGFVIDSKKHLILTAGHCDRDKVMADGTPAMKMYKDERKDLMVLRAYAVERPALKLAAKGPDRGDEVASLGFGAGLEQPMFRIAHVSNTKLEIQGLSGPYLLIDAAFVGGQSGCPVVNQQGEVVGIVQMTAQGFGFGVGAEVIKDKVGRFFSEDK